MVAFGSCALLMVVLQRTILSVIPPIAQDAQDTAFMSAIDAIHGVWAIYMPLMIAGGLMYAITGLCLRYASEFARRLAQINAVLGYVWLAAYAVSCYHLVPTCEKLWGLMPSPVIESFGVVSIVGTTVIFAAIPTGLLVSLSRERTSDSTDRTW